MVEKEIVTDRMLMHHVFPYLKIRELLLDLRTLHTVLFNLILFPQLPSNTKNNQWKWSKHTDRMTVGV